MHIHLPISVATLAAAAVSGSKEEAASMCLVLLEADVASATPSATRFSGFWT